MNKYKIGQICNLNMKSINRPTKGYIAYHLWNHDYDNDFITSEERLKVKVMENPDAKAPGEMEYFVWGVDEKFSAGCDEKDLGPIIINYNNYWAKLNS